VTQPDRTSSRFRGDASGAPWATAGLILAIAIGVSLRLIWPEDIEYKGDELWTFERVRAVLSGASWPWIGMATNIVVVRHSAVSVWIFVGLGKLFAVRTPPELATAVQIFNITAIIGFVAFAKFAIAAARREPWYWAAALWALNPLAIIFERKIWPPCVLTPFTVALMASWWYRHRPLSAFAWGALGAAIGQVYTPAWLLTLALVLWTLLYDRRSVHWPAWLLGNFAAGWPAIPWVLDVFQHGGDAALKLRLFPLIHYFTRWVTQPFGLGIEYLLGAQDMRSYLAGPLIAGNQTYLMGLVSVVLALMLLAVAINVARRLRHGTRPSARDILIGHDNEGVLLRAAFWGYGGLLTLVTWLGPDSHRHYLIVVVPLMALWVARTVFWCDWNRLGGPRAILTAMCIAQGAASLGLLYYIHVKQTIAGEYGPTWRWQQNEPIRR
jgi:hypothetical protein